MKERITSFPFSVFDDPMYDGSSLIYFATALYYRSMAGVLLSIFVYFVYHIAIIFDR
jgi:methylene-fatty-acyl-phospholipid synthase